MDEADYVPMRVKGAVNIVLFVLVIVNRRSSPGNWATSARRIHFPFVREVILVVLAILSLKLGPRGPRASNHFSWGPIIEVAVLFAGIFATMIPALALLEAKGATIGITEPWQYFWLTGTLVVPGQRAHVPRLHLRGPGPGGRGLHRCPDLHPAHPRTRLSTGRFPGRHLRAER